MFTRTRDFVKGRDAIDVGLWEYSLELFTREGRSIDIEGCATWWLPEGCHCLERCGRCGNNIHSPFHGPVFGQPVGSRPYGHEYMPDPKQRRSGVDHE